MIDNEAVQEALRIIAEERRAQARKHKERCDALRSAALFVALVAGSLVAVYGIAMLVLKFVFR